MNVFVGRIGKQIWLLSFMTFLYCCVISQTRQLTTWAITELHLLLLKSSIGLIEAKETVFDSTKVLFPIMVDVESLAKAVVSVTETD